MIAGTKSPAHHNSTRPLLELRSISKRFGRIVACDNVNLTVHAGEIKGLLGQNGAGKSTLMKIASGVVRPDAGQIAIRGESVDISDPLDAVTAGIGMVHQHFSLIGPMPVWKNVTLGDRGRVDRDRSVSEVERISETYGLEVDPHAIVAELTIGQRQRVEIIKCLRREPDIIILDEPTSVLTIGESKALFGILRDLIRESGRGVVLISHRLEEMLEAADDITILRDGKVVSTIIAAEATTNLLARKMLGREVSVAPKRVPVSAKAAASAKSEASVSSASAKSEASASVSVSASAEASASVSVSASAAASAKSASAKSSDDLNDQPVAIQLRNVSYRAPHGQRMLDGLSLFVKAGEILGVAGVEGNGQAALVDMLSNLIRPDSGEVLVNGASIQPGKGKALLDAGVGVIPADRHDSGCVLQMTVAENLILSRVNSVVRKGVIDQTRLFRDAQQLVAEFDIVTSSLSSPLHSLSGGNQQRVVLAREVSNKPNVLVAAEPTHGLDVGAMEYMWSRLRACTEEGTAVLLVSSDLDEILALAHRIVVIYRGKIAGEMPAEQVDLEKLGLLMGGRAA